MDAIGAASAPPPDLSSHGIRIGGERLSFTVDMAHAGVGGTLGVNAIVARTFASSRRGYTHNARQALLAPTSESVLGRPAGS